VTAAYRVRGELGTTTYLGFQVLAGSGLSPRRMATYLSDRDLVTACDGTFSFVLAASIPTPKELDGDPWIEMPEDASALVIREYSSDPEAGRPARLEIESLDARCPATPSDAALAERLTSAAKLMALHHTVMPELLGEPNQFFSAEAAALGSENTTPDNLYMRAPEPERRIGCPGHSPPSIVTRGIETPEKSEGKRAWTRPNIASP
jgi:hypothetical protein